MVGTKLLRKFAPGSMGCALRIDHKWLKFSVMAPAFLPTKIPKKINPRRDSVFALVKMFWISFPSRTPSVLMNVRNTIISTPTNCWTERLMAYFEASAMGWTIHTFGEIDGTKTPT